MSTWSACRGSGIQVTRRSGGGARWNQKWTCEVCGRVIPLAKNGKVRRHAPEVKSAPVDD